MTTQIEALAAKLNEHGCDPAQSYATYRMMLALATSRVAALNAAFEGRHGFHALAMQQVEIRERTRAEAIGWASR